MDDCIFCKIVQKKMPCTLLHEEEEVIAFQDIHPQAPVHAVIIPKAHIARVSELTEENFPLVGKLVQVGNQLAKQQGLTDRGYRLVINCNQEGGQTVFHLHLHLLGGRTFHWPPG